MIDDSGVEDIEGSEISGECSYNAAVVNDQIDVNGMGLRKRERVRKMPYFYHVRRQRKVIRNMTKPLKHWLKEHGSHPYPSKTDKVALASASNMTLIQVSNWFANARRRLKNTVQYPDMPWAERIKLYNSHAPGNAELLSIHSGENDDEQQRQCTEAQRRCTEAANVVAAQAAMDSSCERQRHPVVGGGGGGYGCGIKFKHTILQRYLNDSIKYAHSTSHYPEINQSHLYVKHRQMSAGSSTEESANEECMSPRSADSSYCTPVEESWQNELRDLMNLVKNDRSLLRRTRLDCADLNMKELSAVMALTHLAQGK